MSIFGTILSKIFHHGEAATAPAASQQAPSQAAPTAAPAPVAQPAAPAQPAQPVDVEAVLTQIAAQKGQPSNWRTSIVDLLTLLDMDSSLSARKELADELNVHISADGSAEENIALHKAVMQKLAENGGKVPDNLRN